GRILTGWFSSRTDRPHSAPRSSRTERRASSCLSTEPSVRGALFTVIIAKDIELRAGPRLLIESATFRVNPGDRVGFVGRNGAGKTTLTKVLAGEALPAAGAVTSSGTVGYLPQDPRDVDLEETARDRILSARGLDEVLRDLRAAEEAMAAATGADRDRAVRRYGRLEERLHGLGGYAAEAEAGAMASSLGPPDRAMNQAPGCAPGRPRAARRATQPPGPRRGRAAPRRPGGPAGRARRDQPRRRAARRRRQPRGPPGRQPLRERHLRRRLAEVPGTARDRRAAPQ